MDKLSLIAEFPSLSLGAMQAFAEALAIRLRPADTLTLNGDVGSGKTTFAQALIRKIAVGKPDVTSPTFTLMQSYEVMASKNVPATLWHLDLYRLEDGQQLDPLGLEELWPQIVLIEWPAIAAAMLPNTRLELDFDFAPLQDRRHLALRGHPDWLPRLKEIV